MKRWKILLSLLLVLSGCVSGRSVLSPGESAPPFELMDLSGKPVSLSSFQGKVVLINFWASWCLPCTSEMAALQSLYSRLKDQGFVILAVGVDDDRASLKAFAEQYGLSFPILVDETGGTKRSYGVGGIPESFFVDRDGKIVMVPDLIDNRPVVKVVGPRAWDSPTSEGRVRILLNKGRS